MLLFPAVKCQSHITTLHRPTLSHHVSNSAEVVAYICSSLELPALEALNTMAYFSAMSPYITTQTYQIFLPQVCLQQGSAVRQVIAGWLGGFFLCMLGGGGFILKICVSEVLPLLCPKGHFLHDKYFLSFRVECCTLLQTLRCKGYQATIQEADYYCFETE